jgi:hypothetical protein
MLAVTGNWITVRRFSGCLARVYQPLTVKINLLRKIHMRLGPGWTLRINDLSDRMWVWDLESKK